VINESLFRLSEIDLGLLLQALEWDQLKDFTQQLLIKLRINNFMLRMDISEKNGSVHCHIFGSLPQHLMDRFRSSENDIFDPIMQHIVKSGLPMEWQIEPLCQPNNGGFPYEMLKAYGITAGLSMAARSKHSFTRIDFYSNDLEINPFQRQSWGDLFLFSSHLNEAARSLWAKKIPQQAPILTAREHQCLVWSANGKTSQEIGLILDISRHTVYFHLKKVAAKFNVYGTRHAISRAMEMGLIKPN